MTLKYRAAVLHAPQTPMSIETVSAAALKPTDVLVRIRAAGLCHTDLEVIEGSLRYPLPIVLGHEAAGVVEQVGAAARGVRRATMSYYPGIRTADTASIATATPRSCASNISARDRRRCHSMAKAARPLPMAVPSSS
jgi:threonine dehydrogenase-like Zn-dependent dehydrogenase